MSRDEGSTEVDEGGAPTATNDSSKEEEVVEEGSEESKDSKDTSQKDQETETEEEGEDKGDDGKVKKTEKGTKLDPDPKSAVHQQLANAQRKLAEYEQVLQDPKLLKKYAKESGMSLAGAKEELEEGKDSLKEITPDKLQTTGDIANALNIFRKEVSALREQNQKLQSEISGLSSSRKTESIANSLQRDITAVQAKYPELDPKNPDFDSDLEKEIGEFYHELDFDPRSKSYRGAVSLARVTDRIMKAAGKAGKKASEKTQTDVRVKKSGKVVTSSKKVSGETAESKDPGTVIAQRIAKVIKSGERK